MRKLMTALLLVCCLSIRLQTSVLLSASTENPPLHELLAEVKNIARQAFKPNLLEITSETELFIQEAQNLTENDLDSFEEIKDEAEPKTDPATFLEDYQTWVEDLNV